MLFFNCFYYYEKGYNAALAGKTRKRIEKLEKKANDLGLLDNPELNNLEKKAALAEKVQKQLGKLNAELETLNKKENLTPDEKDSAEEIRHRIERFEKKANNLNLLNNPEKKVGLAKRVQKRLGELNATLEIINKHQSLDPKKDVTLAEETHQNPTIPYTQQAKAPDLLKNSGKTESQESSKEGKGLFSKAFHFVQRMFRNVLAEVINAYRAENKDDHKVFVQRDSGYNTSFVRINKQEFNLEPGKGFNHKDTGINICITYKNNDLEQTPGAVMNININGIGYDIQPGKIWRYRDSNHELAVDVVRGCQQGMDINQSQEVTKKGVENTTEAEVLKALGPAHALEGVKAQPAQNGAKQPFDTPAIKRESIEVTRL